MYINLYTLHIDLDLTVEFIKYVIINKDKTSR